MSMVLCGVLSAACDDPPYPASPPTPQQREAEAAKAQTQLDARFRDMVSKKQYVAAANFVLSEQLFLDTKRPEEVRKLISARAGEVEGMKDALERMNGYGELAHLARKAGLPTELAQEYAASAVRAGVTVDNLDVVQNAVLHAKEFDVELDLRQRAATRVWAMQIDREGWPKPGTQMFVDQFPLSGGFGSAAYTTAMDLGRWKAARMIAERAQLTDEQFRAARTKEVEDLVAVAIRARDDQGLLQLNLEAPGYVDASVVKTVAAHVVTDLLKSGLMLEAGEAYALALAHGLDVEHTKQAADAFFADAIRNRTFSLARQMPDGTFIIVERPPAPPTASSKSTPPQQFESRGH